MRGVHEGRRPLAARQKQAAAKKKPCACWLFAIFLLIDIGAFTVISGMHSIHNVMEELVKTEVDRLFGTAETQGLEWLSCTCPQCRGDVICYVLNKVPPRYIRSSRGIAHYIESEKTEKPQVSADISAIALEGMKQVSKRKRPHLDDDGAGLKPQEGGQDSFFFNFPLITGRVLDGLSFEPLAGVSVTLCLDGEPCKPLGPSWDNPFITNEHAPGNFALAAMPLPASFASERKIFDFEIKVAAEGKDPVVHFVRIGATGAPPQKDDLRKSDFSIVLPDIFVFPADYKLDSMR